MDKNDEAYFNSLVSKTGDNINITKIQEDCIILLNEAIIETVYSHQNGANGYDRTNQLRDINNIKCKIDGLGNLIVYIDTDSMNYYTFGKGGSNTGRGKVDADAVIHFLEVGHDIAGDYSRNIGSSYDYWNNYPAQHFLEVAKEKIKARYPYLNVNIIRDQPNLG